MHPLEQLFFFLLMSDVFWGAAVAVYVLIAVPVIYLIFRKKDKK